MTAIIDQPGPGHRQRAAPDPGTSGSRAHRLEAEWMLCRMATAAGAALCLAALAAPLAWQGLFLAGLMIVALNDRRAAALAGITSVALLIGAPFIGAAPWGPPGPRWPGWIWATSGEVDPTALRTIAALAILLLANSVALPRGRTRRRR